MADLGELVGRFLGLLSIECGLLTAGLKLDFGYLLQIIGEDRAGFFCSRRSGKQILEWRIRVDLEREALWKRNRRIADLRRHK